MCLRTWVGTLLIIILVSAGLSVVGGRNPASRSPRSEHSQPARKLPAAQVTVTEDGKTFHHPECPYIHGRAKLVSAQDAVQEGYAPCVRCMQQATTQY